MHLNCLVNINSYFMMVFNLTCTDICNFNFFQTKKEVLVFHLLVVFVI